MSRVSKRDRDRMGRNGYQGMADGKEGGLEYRSDRREVNGRKRDEQCKRSVVGRRGKEKGEEKSRVRGHSKMGGRQRLFCRAGRVGGYDRRMSQKETMGGDPSRVGLRRVEMSSRGNTRRRRPREEEEDTEEKECEGRRVSKMASGQEGGRRDRLDQRHGRERVELVSLGERDRVR